MTRGIPKKRQRAEQLRKKRLQDAPTWAATKHVALENTATWAAAAKTPPKAIPIAQRRSRPSWGAPA